MYTYVYIHEDNIIKLYIKTTRHHWRKVKLGFNVLEGSEVIKILVQKKAPCGKSIPHLPS